jgi:hypothetical protein
LKKFNYLVIALTITFSSCSTDLAVIGKYKEVMVVYGLLDQSQPKQYIKINKAFLGEGSAFSYAQVKDSNQYVNSLNVTLKRLSDGTEYILTPDNTIPKLPGTFYGPDQSNVIYSFNSTGAAALSTTSDYQLLIKNTETGTQVSAKTVLVNDFGNLTSPNSNTPFFNCILSSNKNFQYSIRWQSGKNAKIYQVIIKFNYTDSTATGNVQKQLDWVFPEQTTLGLGGNETMKGDFLGQGFLEYIGNQLNDYAGLQARIPGNVDIITVAAGDELNTFIEVNKPSTSIVQEKPQFTNITNGLGVFSSRYSKTAFSKPMANITKDSLSCGQYTGDLKFLNHLGNVCP